MTLPGPLQGAIAAWLERNGQGGRRAGSDALTATYRAGGSSAAVDLAAYLVARLPATYAAVARVLAETRARRPDLAPESLLDAGSGPGTASWAAVEAWPGLSRVTFLDTAPVFLKLAASLATAGPRPLASAGAVAGSIEAPPGGLGADLVVAAYALAELPLPRAAAAAAMLWAASRSLLVIVEPGTPQGAVPVAPCTHALVCPIAGDDWCHFSVRLARSRAHMHAKGARVPFEDERFAYLVLAREGAPSGLARVIAPPLHAKAGSSFKLCGSGGIEARHVARRDGAAYKLARKLDWGSLFGASATAEDEA